MSTPIITNVSPAYRSKAKIDQKFRFSVRDQDSHVIQDHTDVHLGKGKAFWNGDVLPTENTRAPFEFKALSGFPSAEAVIIQGSNYTEIQKSVVDNVKGIYEFGGLYSPWASGHPLMAAVKMKMAASDVVFDGLGFSGVVVGLKADNKGIAVKFYSGGVVQVHDASFLTTTPTYTASYDWDQGKEHTYYILWHPELDRIRLYVSSDPTSDVPDTLLANGHWSDFSALPVDEIPAIQPVVYFGHGYPTPKSISRWYSASIYNEVKSALLNGVFTGEHLGFLDSDESIDHRSETPLQESPHSWMLLPGSSGKEIVSASKTVELQSEKGSSFGFYRREPKILGGAFLLDIELSGAVRNQNTGSSSGMEVFVDDGIQHTRLALLTSFGSQALGIFIGSQPNDDTHYELYQTGWGALRDYRLLIDPASNVRVISLESDSEGMIERTLISVPHIGLPVTAFPTTSLGFLHNAASNPASASMVVGRVRYSHQVALWESDALPTSPWSQQGAGGSAYLESGKGMVIEDTSLVDHLYFRKSMPTFTSGYGYMVEFLHKISSYGISDLEDPIRETTGVGLRLQDGTYQTTLIFADAGPQIGKLVFVATMSDYEANLLAIRSGESSVEGTYAVVDWSSYHLYRLERNLGSGIRLFLDNSKRPSLTIPHRDISLPPAIGGFQGMDFGSLVDDHVSKSQWRMLRNSTSSGYDGEIFPVLTDNELLDRYDSSLICLVEAESP